MAVHTYDGFFLLDPNKASADWEGASHQVTSILTKHGAELISAKPWGELKLAYPIRRFRKGVYLQTFFKCDAKNLHEIEADCRLSEVIVRKMIVKLHPQIAGGVIAHYTNDHDGHGSEAGQDQRTEAASASP